MSFNLNEEVIDGHLVTAETKKLWAVEMDLAQKLLEVCKKHGLKIWADAGTLLGAVRHKGFIPWDDDMDFVMLREDYNKLIKIGPIEFKEPYFFQSYYTDNFGGGLAKIRNSNTTMLENGYDRLKTDNLGIAIDVFVLDVVPDNYDEFKREYMKVKRLRRMVNNYMILNTSMLRGKTKLLNFFNRIIVSILNVNRLQSIIVKTLSKPSATDNENLSLIDFHALMRLDVNKVKYRKKDLYKETIMLPFCDMMLPAPIGYHEILTLLYGDYKKPVKGGALHTLLLVDSDRSYQEVIAELGNK